MPLSEERTIEELLHLPHDLFANDDDLRPLEVPPLQPKYDLHVVGAILSPWKWTGYMFDSDAGVPNILFPRFSLLFPDCWAMRMFGIPPDDKHLGLRVVEAARTEFLNWWFSPAWSVVRGPIMDVHLRCWDTTTFLDRTLKARASRVFRFQPGPGSLDVAQYIIAVEHMHCHERRQTQWLALFRHELE
jgi:hypothetical protein